MSLKATFERNRQRYEEELTDFLKIPSVSARSEHKQDLARCAEWLAGKLTEVGMAAEVIATPGHPIVYGELLEAGEDAPTVLVYGHYDVQPVEPLDEWESPPFEPTVRDGRIYARGSADDKGQIYLHVKALEAYREAVGTPPINLKFIFEGEEEVGSDNLENFVRNNKERLASDACVVSDTPMLAADLPSVVIGLRGLVYIEVRLRGPRQDLHSGAFGGAVTNPANALAGMIAALKDDKGRITLPGFYDDVIEPSDEEKKALAEIPTTEKELLEQTGAPALGDGEEGVHFLNRIWTRPTLDVNGLLSGYTGEGAKTIIPATAMAKISLRLVPNQDPEAVTQALEEQLRSLLPVGLEMEIERHSWGLPWYSDPAGPLFRAASTAVKEVFGRGPLFIREGGSIPIVPMIERELGVPVLLLGFVLPGSNLHSPNEWLSIEMYHKGIATVTRLYDAIAREYRA